MPADASEIVDRPSAPHGPAGAAGRRLLRDLVAFARGRAATAALLMIAGSLLEAGGVLLLVPVVQILLDEGSQAGGGAFAQRTLASMGLTGPREQIAAVLAVFAALVAVRAVVLLRRDVEVARLCVDFVADLRSRAFRALAALPWSDLAGRGHGRIGHALARDVDRVANTVGVVADGALGVLQLAVQLAIALALAPIITAGVALLGGAAFLAVRDFRRRAERQGAELTDADFELFQTTAIYLRGLKPARAHGLEAAYAATFTTAARRVAGQFVRQQRDFSLAAIALQSAVALIGLAAVAAGVFIVPVAPERLIVVLLILARLSGPFQRVQGAAQHLGYAAAAYASLGALAAEVEHRAASAASAAATPARPLGRAPEIRFGDVSYAGGEAELLAGIECEIPAGRVTAVTGPSGAGKSLFCDLAVGLLTPQSGRVELDGAPLDPPLVARLARSLAYVAQEPFILEDSLRANLTWGCGEVPDDEIWRALEAVGAAELARGLTGGLDGSVRAGGSRFSGGERQRFRLAHALLRRPKLLVLDEATNALDIEAERAVLAGLRRAAPDATMLMVTHRPSTLDLADHILLLEAGRLAWAGPPDAAGVPGRLRLAAD